MRGFGIRVSGRIYRACSDESLFVLDFVRIFLRYGVQNLNGLRRDFGAYAVAGKKCYLYIHDSFSYLFFLSYCSIWSAMLTK